MRILQNRKYKTGTRWALWLWTDVYSEYITRLHILKTPWFAICLHWIKKPDPEPYLHDHPVTFLSLVLWGRYTEVRQRGAEPARYNINRWWNFFRASEQDQHSITWCAPNTLTLCFMGPKSREWGYHTRKGWVHWKNYNFFRK